MNAKTQRHVASIAMCGLLLLVASIKVSLAASRTAVESAVEPDACTLLTTAEVSKALGVTSLAGARLVASNPKACVWSDDPSHDVDHRRVTLSIISLSGFQLIKNNKRIKLEPVSGIGDEAHYEVLKRESPLLIVRKGNTAFNVRVLNGLKLKPFTPQEVKAMEADLAKAAVLRL